MSNYKAYLCIILFYCNLYLNLAASICKEDHLHFDEHI